jgi:hypothetical protein
MGIISQLTEAVTYIEALKNLGIHQEKIRIQQDAEFRASISFWAYEREFKIPLGEIRHQIFF